MEKEGKGEEGEVKKNSNIIKKNKLYHSCNLKSKGGTRKLGGKNENCIFGGTNKKYWKN